MTITAAGIRQDELVDFLVLCRAKFLVLLAKLDLDGTVNSTDYLATYTFAMPAGIQTDGPRAYNQGSLVSFLNTFITNFNLMLAHLDADSGVSGTNFASLWAITDTVGADNADSILDNGLDLGALVNLLDAIVAKMAGLNAKLDLDGGVADTNYATLCNITGTVDSTGTKARPRY